MNISTYINICKLKIEILRVQNEDYYNHHHIASSHEDGILLFLLWSSRFWHFLKKRPSSPQVKQGNYVLFFFFKVVIDLALKDIFTLLLPCEFLCVMLVLEWPLLPLLALFLTRVLSSTSRDTIRFSTYIFCLLCLRVVLKHLREGGDFVCIQPQTR